MPRPKALARVLNSTLPADARLDGPNSARQAEFVRLYAETGNNGKDCARLAGYADAGGMAYYLLNQPHIQAAIRQRRGALINGDLAKKALSTLAELMEPGTPAPVRLGASRTALEMAGHLGIKESPQSLDTKPLAEMSVAELEELVKRGQDVLSSAKIIPATVQALPDPNPSRPV